MQCDIEHKKKNKPSDMPQEFYEILEKYCKTNYIIFSTKNKI